MELQEQKDIALGVLKQINLNLDSEALIAGGAPRNWEDEDPKLAKDIDIYLRVNANTATQAKEMIQKALGEEFKFKESKSSDLKDYVLGLPITHILYGYINGVEFQFITVALSEGFQKAVLTSFDLGICKVGVTSFGRIERPEYSQDRANRTLTFCFQHLSDAQIRCALNRHLPKVMSYYPDHRLVLENKIVVIEVSPKVPLPFDDTIPF